MLVASELPSTAKHVDYNNPVARAEVGFSAGDSDSQALIVDTVPKDLLENIIDLFNLRDIEPA